ncbi:hypothetical protein KKG45_09980 [bacterium]|nr:hypothetical protein [bacterium]MBU1674512.1 hypothetical protein [bacterium]
MRSWLVFCCLFLSLPPVAAAGEESGPAAAPAFEAAAADTIRTNLWVTQALLTGIAREVVAAVPGQGRRVSLRARGKHEALPLFETTLYATLLESGHQAYLDEAEADKTDRPIRPAAADIEIRYFFETCELGYPEVGRKFGLWHQWIDREIEISVLVGVVDLASGRLLMDERLQRRFSDRLPSDYLKLVDEPTYKFTSAEPAEGGIRTILEELVVLGALSGLVAIYFTNTGN